jgi:hemolysin activation/secretion protein
LGRLTLTDKVTDLDAATDAFLQNDHAVGLNVGVVGDRLSSKIRALNAFDANFQYGKLVSDVEQGRGSEYFKVEGNSTSFVFLPVPFTDISTRLLLKTSWQYSDFSLPSYEQQVLGGAQGVRGYTVRDFSADSAFYLGAEWYWNLPSAVDFDFPGGGRLTDFLQTAIFYDGAVGVQNTFEDNDENGYVGLSSAGVLVKFNYADQFSTQFSIAKPVGQRESDSELLDSPSNIKIFADFTYFF